MRFVTPLTRRQAATLIGTSHSGTTDGRKPQENALSRVVGGHAERASGIAQGPPARVANTRGAVRRDPTWRDVWPDRPNCVQMGTWSGCSVRCEAATPEREIPLQRRGRPPMPLRHRLVDVERRLFRWRREAALDSLLHARHQDVVVESFPTVL